MKIDIHARTRQATSQELLKVERWSLGEQTLLSATFQFSSGATDGETIMNEVSLLRSLGQVSASETGEVFRAFLRGHVREMISEVMAAEVTELCGPKHAPSPGDHYRAGSSPGRVLVDGEREEVVRPRVRCQDDQGASHEVELATYRVAKDPTQLQAQIMQAIIAGVSSRSARELKPNFPGVGRSNVSRLWQETGAKFIDQLRSKELSSITWCALMLDGIRLSSEQTAVVALGIDREGNKHVLDFVLGSSESLEISRELVSRIVARGFQCDHRLYVVLDGSAALRGAVKEFFPDSVVQRCLVHKERNIKGKLSKRHWGELSRLFRRLRNVQGYESADEVFGEFETVLAADQRGRLPELAGSWRGLVGASAAERSEHVASFAAEHQCDREFILKHASQAWPRDAFPGRDGSSKSLAFVRVAGGGKRLPEDCGPRISERVDQGVKAFTIAVDVTDFAALFNRLGD